MEITDKTENNSDSGPTTGPNTGTNRKAAHNAKVRARILASSAQLFRAQGYHGVAINELMAAADLTRGAFYAHFASKEALFAAVLGVESPLLLALQARQDTDAGGLWAGCEAAFQSYLAPKDLASNSMNCPFARLSQDAGRLGPEVGRAFERAHRRLLQEMARGQAFRSDHPALIAGLSLATGTMATACAMASRSRASLMLLSAQDELRLSWTPLRQLEES